MISRNLGQWGCTYQTCWGKTCRAWIWLRRQKWSDRWQCCRESTRGLSPGDACHLHRLCAFAQGPRERSLGLFCFNWDRLSCGQDWPQACSVATSWVLGSRCVSPCLFLCCAKGWTQAHHACSSCIVPNELHLQPQVSRYNTGIFLRIQTDL